MCSTCKNGTFRCVGEECAPTTSKLTSLHSILCAVIIILYYARWQYKTKYWTLIWHKMHGIRKGNQTYHLISQDVIWMSGGTVPYLASIPPIWDRRSLPYNSALIKVATLGLILLADENDRQPTPGKIVFIIMPSLYRNFFCTCIFCNNQRKRLVCWRTMLSRI